MSERQRALCSPAIVRPRVLINAASLWHGGSSRNYHRNLLSELERDSRGFDFSVVALSGELDAVELGPHELIEVRLPTRGRVPLRVLWEQFVLPRRAASFDLLYCTSDLSPFWGPTPTVVAHRATHLAAGRTVEDDVGKLAKALAVGDSRGFDFPCVVDTTRRHTVMCRRRDLPVHDLACRASKHRGRYGGSDQAARTAVEPRLVWIHAYKYGPVAL